MKGTQVSTIPCALGLARQGLPLTDSTQMMLLGASSGGTGTASFFQRQYQLVNFVNWLNASGAKAWTLSKDNQGNPLYTASQAQSAFRMQLATLPAQEVLDGKQTPEQFTLQNQGYQIVGSLTGTVSYNMEPLWYVEVPLGVADLVPISVLSGIAWANLIQPLLQGFLSGVRSCFSSLAGAGEAGADAVADAAAAAAEEATVDAAVVEGATISMAAGVAAFAGIALLAAIPLLLALLAHPSYHTIKCYNLTNYDITWALPCFNEGVLSAAPITAQGSNSYNFVIPAVSSWAPPGVQPVQVAHEADFSFASDSDWNGIGYVMPFTLNDPNQGGAIQATASLLFDIPWAGDNSLYVTFDPQNDLASFYQTFAGKCCQTQMRGLREIEGTPITVTITYDYLSGEHPDPNGQNSYLYNSVVVFSPLSS